MNSRRRWLKRLERVRRAWRVCVTDPWYWLRCRIWHRFNVIYIKTLSPTFHDRDRVLLHAAFQILTDFVDREHPFDHFDVTASDNRADWEEILRLYAWWTVERPAKLELLNTPCTTPTILRAVREAEEEHENEDQEMLVRLILVRKMLWT